MPITAQNANLNAARINQNDEFYTQTSDIEKELRHYKHYFKGKVVYCNCDDPKVSNFFRHFYRNFEYLQLNKLISVCYKNQDPGIFTQNKSKKSVYIVCDGRTDANGTIKKFRRCLKKDGDFRSDESIALLQESDIVVTNPPFSLFRQYVAQLIQYDKKFVIIGSMNAVTYKETFLLIKENKVWLGASIHSGDREFGVPDHYPLNAASSRVDENGNKFIRVKGVRWFTNLDYQERHADLILYKTYAGNESEYPKYDNYDAINVDKTKDIPVDYAGAMGVPISFLDKYNPEQFEILGIANSGRWIGYNCLTIVNGRRIYNRLIIRNNRLQP